MQLVVCKRCKSTKVDVVGFVDLGERAIEYYRCENCGEVFKAELDALGAWML